MVVLNIVQLTAIIRIVIRMKIDHEIVEIFMNSVKHLKNVERHWIDFDWIIILQLFSEKWILFDQADEFNL